MDSGIELGYIESTMVSYEDIRNPKKTVQCCQFGTDRADQPGQFLTVIVGSTAHRTDNVSIFIFYNL